MNREPGFFIGYDPAQLTDYSAVVVIQKLSDKMQHLRHILRFPRGTPYAKQAQSMVALYRSLHSRLGAVLTADATGLGRPVLEMICERGVPVHQIVISGGEAEGESGPVMTVPKAHLIGALVRVIQEKRLLISKDLPEAKAFADEMKAFVLKRKDSGHEGYEAAGTAHDDLVLAAALASWEASREHLIVGLYEYLRRRENARGG